MKESRIRQAFRKRGGRWTGLLLIGAMLLAACPAAALADKPPVNLEPYASYVDPGETPELVKVNVFDYWLESGSEDEEVNRYTNDKTNYDHFAPPPSTLPGSGGAYTGINGIHDPASQYKSHILHFRTGGRQSVGANGEPITIGPETFYSDRATLPGLVKNRLGEDGYPIAQRLKDDTGSYLDSVYADVMPTEESLAYLFNPAIAHKGKASYTNVGGLFRVDQEGYYYFNSMLENTKAQPGENLVDNFYGGAYDDVNYAYLDESDPKNPRFILYNEWAVTHRFTTSDEEEDYDNRSGSMSGQFFPFNPPNQVFTIENGKLNGSALTCNNQESPLNHYLGLSLEVPFVQTVNGMSRLRPDEPTTFYFSGDDDMWLFIDGVLVGDQGGIHDATKLKVDFSTGLVEVNGRMPHDTTDGPYNGHYITTLANMYKQALGIQETDEQFEKIFKKTASGDYIFHDNSHHLIKIFYLERGHTASNLGLKFNLATIPSSELKKVDQDGNALNGAEFALYRADQNYNILDKTNPLYVGRTADNGTFQLIHVGESNPRKGFPVSFAELEGDYFVLRERMVPEGYRSEGDMHLKKHVFGDGAVTLISDPNSPKGSKWSTGSYASAKQLTSVNERDIWLHGDTPGTKGLQILKNGQFADPSETGGIDYKQGKMFAFIAKWISPNPIGEASEHELNDPSNWAPVYSDAHGNYHLIIPEDNTEAAYAKVLSTVLQNNPWQFYLGDSGYYQVEIEQMPGDIIHYLHANQADDISKVQYSIFYGWTDAAELSQASPKNHYERLYSDRFTRSFSATFNAVNTLDKLNVLKVDENNQPMGGIRFILRPVLMDQNGNPLPDPERLSLEKVTDADDGTLTFSGLKEGWYLLEEDEATLPDGIQPSDPVPVFVKTQGWESGVYAYAGEKDDGVQVRRGVGTLVRTMHEFGVNDDLDRTLHNIIVTPQLWDGKWQTVAPAAHLHHTHSQTEHAFVPMNGTSNEPYTYTFDEGWPHLLIQQCPEADANISHSPAKTNAYWEPLGDRAITNLFTRDVTVIITNYKKHDPVFIEGAKILEGRMLTDAEFSFRIKALTEGAPMPDETIVRNAQNGRFRFGPIRFAYDLNKQTYEYRIDEIKGTDASVVYDDSYWIVTVQLQVEGTDVDADVRCRHYDAQGKLLGEGGSVAFTNRVPSSVPATDDSANLWLWMLGMLLSAGCMSLLMAQRRKQTH